MKKYKLLIALVVIVSFAIYLTPNQKTYAGGGAVRVVRLWDKKDYSGQLLIDRYESSGCRRSGGWGNVNLAYLGVDERAESGRGYNGCNKLKVYRHAYHSGSSKTCRPNCRSFGSLNNDVSSYELSR